MLTVLARLKNAVRRKQKLMVALEKRGQRSEDSRGTDDWHGKKMSARSLRRALPPYQRKEQQIDPDDSRVAVLEDAASRGFHHHNAHGDEKKSKVLQEPGRPVGPVLQAHHFHALLQPPLFFVYNVLQETMEGGGRAHECYRRDIHKRLPSTGGQPTPALTRTMVRAEKMSDNISNSGKPYRMA